MYGDLLVIQAVVSFTPWPGSSATNDPPDGLRVEYSFCGVSVPSRPLIVKLRTPQPFCTRIISFRAFPPYTYI